jgi:O-antigen/teichoic acid export membrane protein
MNVIRLKIAPTDEVSRWGKAFMRGLAPRVFTEENVRSEITAWSEGWQPSVEKHLQAEIHWDAKTIQLRGGGERDLAIPNVSSSSQSDVLLDSAESLGAGLFLIRQLADNVQYQPSGGENVWNIRRALPIGKTLTSTPAIEIEIPANLQYLSAPAALLDELLIDFDEGFRYEVRLILQELLVNIVRHAYAEDGGTIWVKLATDVKGQNLIIETRDKGRHTFDLQKIPDAFSPPTFPKVGKKGLLTGGAIFFLSATIVNAGNYLYNLLLGRWLGPAAFADVSLIVTLFLMISFVAVTFMMTAARFSALYTASGETHRIAATRRFLLRIAYGIGIVLLIGVALGAPAAAQFFNTQSFWPFIILAVGFPFYLAQGVNRGILQGRTWFGWLSLSYQAEMWVRLGAAALFIWVGWEVNGAIGALTLSILATWLVAQASRRELPLAEPLSSEDRRAMLLFAIPVVVAQLSQILINNSDVLIVKRFFVPVEAGQYAALALIGRIVFFATWSVVTTLFPIVAQRQAKGEPHRILLWLAMGLVVVVAGGVIGATLLFPNLIVQVLFGDAYLGIAPLLWLYGVATALYALANVVINYRLSLGDGFGSVLAVIAGIAQVVSLWLFHDSLRQVVFVQIGIMVALFAGLMVWDTILVVRERTRRRD